MAVLVHLTSHRNIASIRRTGLRPDRRAYATGVYALPVTHNFQISHQWLRELRRQGSGTIMGVYFRISDDEEVKIGHYGSAHLTMTAAEAHSLMLSAERVTPASARAADAASRAVRERRSLPSSPEGFEVIVPRAIRSTEILRVKALPQVVGWRHKPGANGSPPCACICCERGSFGIRRLLRRVEKEEAAGRTPRATLFGRDGGLRS